MEQTKNKKIIILLRKNHTGIIHFWEQNGDDIGGVQIPGGGGGIGAPTRLFL